jgi:hypothetical protein
VEFGRHSDLAKKQQLQKTETKIRRSLTSYELTAYDEERRKANDDKRLETEFLDLIVIVLTVEDVPLLRTFDDNLAL